MFFWGRGVSIWVDVFGWEGERDREMSSEIGRFVCFAGLEDGVVGGEGGGAIGEIRWGRWERGGEEAR